MSFKRLGIGFITLVAIILITGGAVTTIVDQENGIEVQTVLPGRNVNMVSGTVLPGGDPWLQRQNEPSAAVSTRNPMHILAAANDYRTVDMPFTEGELPGIPGYSAGDAWMGIYKSFDGGESWYSDMLEGYPQGGEVPSPLYGYDTAADPVLRAGPAGMFYLTGICFDRASRDESIVFVSRFIDNNNVENFRAGGDPIEHIDSKGIVYGNDGQFPDKPWIAVDKPRGTGTLSINGQSIPSHNVYIAHTVFVGNLDKNIRSKVMFKRSTDCGQTWQTAIKLNANEHINQGTQIAIDPNDGTVYVVWRRFNHGNDDDGIVVCKSTDFGQSFTNPVDICQFYPSPLGAFDQPSSSFAEFPPEGEAFRSNTYPSLTIDGQGILYCVLAERGWTTTGDARIMLYTSSSGTSWNGPYYVADHPGTGHQIMPAVAYGGGKLSVIWYDQKYSVGNINCGAGDWINDQGLPNCQWRETLDVFVAQAEPGLTPLFELPMQVSRYLWGLQVDGNGVPIKDVNGYPIAQQLQYNPPNYPLFRGGQWPFIGDYIDLATSPSFIFEGGNWHYNLYGTTPPVFHAVWTDNRDVRPPFDNIWTNYTPPASVQPNEGFADISCASVVPTRTGMRNQNIYTSKITRGIIVVSPNNNKPLGTLGNYLGEGEIPRAFVIYVSNPFYLAKSFRLTILQGGANAPASFLEFDDIDEIDVTVAGYSTLARSVFVYSGGGSESVQIDVEEIFEPGGGFVPDGLTNFVVLNPDPSAPNVTGDLYDNEVHNPNIANPNIANPNILNPNILNWSEAANPNIANPNILNPNILNPNIANPNILNPNILNPNILNPNILNPNIANPNILNPNILNPNIANPNILNPNILNPNILNPNILNPNILNPNILNPNIANYTPEEADRADITDAFWIARNDGNTTSTYTFKMFSKDEVPPGIYMQLLIYRVHYTPSADFWEEPAGGTLSVATEDAACDLKVEPHHELILNVVNPNILNPNIANPNILNPNILNAAIENTVFSLEPGEEVAINLRVVEPDPSDFKVLSDGSLFNVADFLNDVGVSATGHAVNTDDAHDGKKTPPVFATQLVISNTSLPDGEVNVPYARPDGRAVRLHAFGGDGSYTWTLNSGEMPYGLGLDGSGTITGTPTTEGMYDFVVMVSDGAGKSDTQEYTIIIYAQGDIPDLGIITISPLPNALKSIWYGARLEAEGGTWPRRWRIADYSTPLPPGLSLDSGGLISGTPKELGVYTFSVTVLDSGSPKQTDTKEFQLEVKNYNPLDKSAYPDITISGTIYNGVGGLPLEGVLLRGVAGEPMTDEYGQYSFTVPYQWSGTIEPFMVGYSFTPENTEYSSLISNQTGQDYNESTTLGDLTFIQQPTNVTAGQPISPTIQVQAMQGGSPIQGVTISLAIGNNPSGGSIPIIGTITDVNGIAFIGPISIDKGGDGYTLIASASAWNSVESDPFDVEGFSSTGPMLQARAWHTMTVLTTGSDAGKVLVAGGMADDTPTYLNSCEIYDPAAQSFGSAPSMLQTRAYHTATTLKDDTILFVGGEGTDSSGAEIYDPVSGLFAPTVGGLSNPRIGHTATRLQDGTVLIVGGTTPGLTVGEIYDPATGYFTETTGVLPSYRYHHTSTLLPDGAVLIAGGKDGTDVYGNPLYYDTAFLFDPHDQSFSATATLMNYARGFHSATLLNDGTVLVAHGENYSDEGSAVEPVVRAELYHPDTGVFEYIGYVMEDRFYHSAVLMDDGSVLMVGGSTNPAEIYDTSIVPAEFRLTGGLAEGRQEQSAVLLPDGSVLITGGRSYEAGVDMTASGELFEPFSAVDPGAVAYFEMTVSGASQTAGVPFGITITAKDSGGSTVTGYDGSNVLSDSTGTITPEATGVFINGVWTGDVNIAAAGPDTTIYTWGSGKSGESTPISVTITQYTLTVSKSGTGSGSVTSGDDGIDCGSDCTENYDSGEPVVLTPAPDGDSEFAGWTGDVPVGAEDDNPLTITMDATKSVTAAFNKIQYTMTMNTAGNGTVLLVPPGPLYDAGTVVSATATSGADSDFVDWSGDHSDTGNPTLIPMNGNKTVLATFALKQYNLNITYAGSGNGSVTLDPTGGVYTHGQSVEMTAIPVAGSAFTGWSGDHGGTTSPDSIVMDGEKNVVAGFDLSLVTISGTVSTGAGSGVGTLSTMDLGGVTMTGFPGDPITTAPDGTFSVDVPYNWSGAVIPEKSGYIFEPVRKVYVDVTSSIIDEDYEGVEGWISRYDGGIVPAEADQAVSIGADLSGNVYVTGWSGGDTFDEMNATTIKYTGSTGVEDWVTRCPGWQDFPTELSIFRDASGNDYVFATGYGNSNLRFITLKYAGLNGNAEWGGGVFYDNEGVGQEHGANAIFVDPWGDVYVAGSVDDDDGSTIYDLRYAVVKYDGATSTQLWATKFGDGPGDEPQDIVADAMGNVYVTGASTTGGNRDFLTVKFDRNGNHLWEVRYDSGFGDDTARAMIFDPVGHIYVVGSAATASNGLDYLLIKYDLAGNEVWTATYDGPWGFDDSPVAMVSDGTGNLYVTGRSDTSGAGANYDFATAKFMDSGATGSYVVAVHYNGPGTGQDYAKAIEIDPFGYIYVTGQSEGSGDDDFATIKYEDTGAAFNPIWTRRYDSGYGADGAKDLALDTFGNLYVTGTSTGDGTASDYATIGYRQAFSNIAIRTTGLQSGIAGEPYAAQLEALGGNGARTWSLTSGSLPTGMDLDGLRGIISGTPATTGTFNIEVTVQDGGLTDEINLSLNVATGALHHFDVDAPDTAHAGVPVSITVTAKDAGGNTTTLVSGDTSLTVDIGTIDPFVIAEGEFIDDGVWTGDVTLSDVGINTITVNNAGRIGSDSIDVVALPTVQFTFPATQGSEGTTPALLQLSLSDSIVSNVTVNYAVTGGDAESGTDYTLAAGIATILGGELTTNIEVVVADDDMDEPNETIELFIHTPTNATLGVNTTHTYTIEDNDAEPTVAFVGLPYSQTENGASKTIFVEMTGTSSQLISVPYTTSDDTATAGEDYEAKTGAAGWAPGTSGTYAFNITVLNDFDYEGDEAFNITLTPGTGYTITPPASTSFTIIEDDTAPAIALDTEWIPDALLGSVYSSFIEVIGGVPPITWTKDSGTLPTDLVLNESTGEISGTPSEAGVFTFGIRAEDSLGQFVQYAAEIVVAEWLDRYNNTVVNGNDEALVIKSDVEGNVFVTGESEGAGSGKDIYTIKYDSSGAKQWEQRYDGGFGDDSPTSMAVDAGGTVYVSGYSTGNGTGSDYIIVGYNSAGTKIHEISYDYSNGPDQANDIAVDASGNIYVTGKSSSDYHTIKYDSSGTLVWEVRYDGGFGNDYAYAMFVDHLGNVYVTGTSDIGGSDSYFCTIKYDSSGNQVWLSTHDGLGQRDNAATEISIDLLGNVYIMGLGSESGTDADIITIKYDSSGTEQWVRDDGDSTYSDGAAGFFVDSSGNSYLLGSAFEFGESRNYIAKKYNNLGGALWSGVYDGIANDTNDWARALAVDPIGHVYVTGDTMLELGMSTKYGTARLDSLGGSLHEWDAWYEGSAGDDIGKDIVLDRLGNIYVTGTSAGAGTSNDYATLKYAQSFPSDLIITTDVIDWPMANVPYAAAVWAFGGSGARHWEVTSGALPTGLTIDPDSGVISGTTTETGTFNFDVTVTDGILNDTQNFAIETSVGALDHFLVDAPATGYLGVPVGISITAKDAFGNTTTLLTGDTDLTVNVGTIDPDVIAEAELTDDGVWTGAVTLSELGTITITAGNSGKTGTDAITILAPPAPEINIHEGGDDIDDGGAFGFGSQTTGTDTDVVFTIQNIGTADLAVTTPITISGTDFDQFSVFAQPASPVGQGSSTTFTIRFSPTSVGAKSASIAIANNDGDEDPYNIDLTGTGVLPVYGADGYTFLHRMDITIDSTKIDEDLNYFPVLVRLDSTNIEFLDFIQAHGQDIRFAANIDGSGDAVGGILDHEIERFDVDNYFAEIWVEIPVVGSDADTTFYMFYGHDTCPDGQDIQGVWNEGPDGAGNDNYVMTYHMDETGTTHNDSAGANDAGTSVNAVTDDAQGKIDGAVGFDGVSSYINCTDNAQAEGTHGTYEAWIKLEPGLEGYNLIVSKGDDADSQSRQFKIQYWGPESGIQVELNIRRSPTGDWAYIRDTWPLAIHDLGRWHHAAVMWGTPGMRLYVDGVLRRTNTDVEDGFQTSRPIEIGNYSSFVTSGYYDYAYKGSIDEVRISNIQRSDAWMKATYHSGNNSLLNISGTIVNSVELSGPASVEVDTVSGAFTLTSVNGEGTPVDVIGNTVFHLSSSSPGTVTFYSDAGGISPITSVTILDGSNSATFYYEDSEVADATVSASFVSGLVDLGADSHLIAVQAAPAPEINMQYGAAIDIIDGGSADLGSVLVGSYSDTSFTIQNLGNLDLIFTTPITISGPDAGQFNIEPPQPSSPIAQSGSETFTVRFSPTSVGAKTASLSIPNNDADEDPYDIVLNGTGYLTGYTAGGFEFTDRMDITIDSSVVDAPLVYFPVLVRLDSSNMDFGLFQQANGQDIRFSAAIDGGGNASGELLDFEIERFDTVNEMAEVWVEIPSIEDSSDTTFYMFFGHDSCPDGQDVEHTWDEGIDAAPSNDFVIVHHLQETSGIHYDSTSKNNDGSSHNGVVQDSSGRINGADRFDGNFSYLDFGDIDEAEGANGTYEAWIKLDTGIDSYNLILSKASSSSGMARTLRVYPWTDDQVQVQLQFRVGSTWYTAESPHPQVMRTGTWYHVAGVWGSGGMVVYVNGEPKGTNSYAAGGTATSYSLALGNWKEQAELSSNTWAFEGNIDEARVSRVKRSAAWIKASYHSQNNSLLDIDSGLVGQVELTGPVEVISDVLSGVFTLTSLDGEGSPANVLGDTVFDLSSTEMGTASFFEDAGETIPIDSATISGGTSSATFYYKNSVIGDQLVWAHYASGPVDLSADNHVISVTVAPSNPIVIDISPNQGTTDDTALIVSVTGSDFQNGADVELNFNGGSAFSASSVTYVNDTELTATFDLSGVSTELGQAWDVKVTNPDAQSGIGSDLFTIYLPNPTVTAITPVSGMNTGSIAITNLEGTNFVDGVPVFVRLRKATATIDATDEVVVSDTQITCTFDLTGAEAGQWNVIVAFPSVSESSGILLNGFSVTAPVVATQLVFTTQPGGGEADSAWSQQPVVEVQDIGGNTFTSDNTTEVTLAIENNPGSGVLAGHTTVTVVGGVATFADLEIFSSGFGYTLMASAPGLDPDTSIPFDVPEAIVTIPEEFDYTEDGGASGFDSAYDVDTDIRGDVYVTGKTTSASSTNMYIVKYNLDGTIEWDAHLDDPPGIEDYGKSITVDSKGNVYVVGTTNDDVATVKYDSAGVQKWISTYDGPDSTGDYGVDIVVDDSGYVYVAGVSKASAQLDYATIKYNPDGSLAWSAPHSGYSGAAIYDSTYGNDIPSAIGVDSAGNVVVTGRSEGSSGSWDYYTVQYDSSGNFVWEQRFDRNGYDDFAEDLVVDESDNIYITGAVTEISPLNPYTIKYDSSGNQLIDWMYGTNDNEHPIAIALDSSGNAYIAGSVFDGVSYSIYTSKCAFGGGVEWQRTFQSQQASDAQAFDIVLGSLGGVYVTGFTTSPNLGPEWTTIKYDSDGNEAWIRSASSEGDYADQAHAIAVDLYDNVIVVGERYSETDEYDIRLMRLKPGIEDWVKTFGGTGAGNDEVVAISTDSEGNVYVAGNILSGATNHFATVKYHSSGPKQWDSLYTNTGTLGQVKDVAVDDSGNVYITGRAMNAPYYDCITIKYNDSGVEEWVATYWDGGEPESLSVDASGNVYIATSGGEIVKYSSVGDEQWIQSPSAYTTCGFKKLKVDTSGNVYATGWATTATAQDYLTIKLNTNGVEQWHSTYTGPSFYNDVAWDLILDSSSNVFVTGFINDTSLSDLPNAVTIKYDSTGTEVWVAEYDSGGRDYGSVLSLDAAGNIYVAGYNRVGSSFSDMLVIKYNSLGDEQFSRVINGSGDGADYANAICVDTEGNFYVTGKTVGFAPFGAQECTTIKYDATGNMLWLNSKNGAEGFDISCNPDDDVYVGGSIFESGFGTNFLILKIRH